MIIYIIMRLYIHYIIVFPIQMAILRGILRFQTKSCTATYPISSLTHFVENPRFDSCQLLEFTTGSNCNLFCADQQNTKEPKEHFDILPLKIVMNL